MLRTELGSYFEQERAQMIELLRRLVETESPTLKQDSVNEVGSLIAQELRDQGAAVALDRQTERGHHVIGTFGDGEEAPVLMIGHMDTVWPLGTINERPFRLEGDVAFGPGTFDMKAGLVIMIFVLRAARALNLRFPRPLTLLFNSDEEQRSEFSRDLILDEAARSAYALVFEGSPDASEVTTKRRASGRFTISAHGKASHAGAAIAEGVNAIEELSHQIQALQGMTDLEVGTTVSVGVVSGGTQPNVVPARADAQTSVRAATASEMERIEGAIKSLKPVLPGSRLEVRGGFHRGPYEETASNLALLAKLAAAAEPLGIAIRGRMAGGASDANLTSSIGTPTLDGLGGVGGGAHSVDEHVQISSLITRATMVTALLLDLD